MVHQHLPLTDAAMELLEEDDDEFARRRAVMRDEDDRASSTSSPAKCSGFGGLTSPTRSV